MINKRFSISDYNSALKSLPFSASDSGDKPSPVPISTTKKSVKLGGKAISHWVHIRSFPLIAKKFRLDPTDPVLTFVISLHEIVERLTAQEFLSYEIDILEEKVHQYLELRSCLRTQYPDVVPNPKPKHHYIRL